MGRKLAPGSAFVALGANLPGELGDPAETLLAVLPELQALSRESLLVSSFYESDPKDCPPGSPRYVNAVVALLPLSGEDPQSLLRKLQAIEQTHGRVRTGLRNEARTLDLDLLDYAGLECDSDTLVLPHPRAHERRFVLEPWIEIAGEGWLFRGRPLADWEHECADPPLSKLQ